VVGRKGALPRALLAFAVVGALAAPSAASAVGCPNEAFRTGISTRLPDCRAYELVTPPDTNGRQLQPITADRFSALWDLFPVELSSEEGGSFVYEVFAGALAAPAGGSGAMDVYRAQRGEAGWATTQRISRSSSDINWTLPGGISSDHGYAFSMEHNVDFLRQPDGSFELTGLGSLAVEPYAQGRYISEGGGHVVFSTGLTQGPAQSEWCVEAGASCAVNKLEPDAPPKGTGAIYDRSADGPTHVISLLPGDETPTAKQQAFYQGTSEDASSVAFKICEECSFGSDGRPLESTLYVRADNGLAGERTEEVASGETAFGGLSEEGRFLFYVDLATGTIHRFDTTDEADVEVNAIGEGEIVNVSADGSHVYFISQQQLDGSKGTLGQPNLYVWRGGAPEYIATVLPSDLVETSPGIRQKGPYLTAWTQMASPSTEDIRGPDADSSRSTPNGSVLVFESRAKLTLYDNAGHTEIYRYEDGAGLMCVTCWKADPATTDAHLQNLDVLPPWIILHNLSDDGSRVFFETDEALVERDTNGDNDAYEWHEEDGGGTTIDLISSGRPPTYPPWKGWRQGEPYPNALFAITPEGSDVFFTASEALTPGAGENGTQAIYDARIDGGVPAPVSREACVEEDCKSGAIETGLPFSGPESEATRGSGNVRPHRGRCRHRGRGARRKQRGHCARGHHKKGARRSSAPGPQTPPSEEVKDAAGPSAPGPISELDSSGLANAPVVSAGSSSHEFGIERWTGGISTPVAGMHPDFVTQLVFNHYEAGGYEEANAAAEEVSVHLPPGLLGNPEAVPACSMGDFSAFGNCSPDTQVGVTTIRVGFPSHGHGREPVFNLTPPHPKQEIARFGFIAWFFPVFIDVRVRTAGDYGATATIEDPPGLGVPIRAVTTLWGNPSSFEHDEERATPDEVIRCPVGRACEAPDEKWSSGIPAEKWKAFMTNPSACQEMPLGVEAKSYQLPGQVFEKSTALPPITDCSGLPFAPTFEADPTSHVAGAPTGLKTKLVLPQHLGPEERATSTMREARVTLPAGMQVAAGAANWIGTCSEEQVGFHREVDAACPDASKLGTATISSPYLPQPIEGALYQRNPTPGHQFGLWLVSDALGLHIKLPGELSPDKQTGRLTAVFSDLPQVPVSEIDLDVWGGPRAPLQNPDRCGTYVTDYTFAPHSSDPAVSGSSQMQITEGCSQPFDPALRVGVTEPVAGRFSPFVFDLTRGDGSQALRGFTLHLPDGELAKLRGVPLCSDADAANGSCPVASRIGSLQALTGPGPEPLQIPQSGKSEPEIYLAGPYRGSPFSIVSEVPAQAGPFDLGTLAVRSGLGVEPETGRGVVEADPLPQFFEGVGIAYRRLHAVIDRPRFSLNPTDCREMKVNSDVASTQGVVAHPTARFEVDGCRALRYRPRLELGFRGETERTGDPAIEAVLRQAPHQANTGSATVLLPRGEFIDNAHIGTPCTMPRFRAEECPRKSILGTAKAISPLLDRPLKGKVYFRSNGGARELPDIVADLRGQIHIVLVGYIDAVKTGPEASRVRTRFLHVPDAPVSRFTMSLFGGERGLVENSADLCRGTHRARIDLVAQNGRAIHGRPPLETSCPKTRSRHKNHR
jgi:hypothetical protein